MAQIIWELKDNVVGDAQAHYRDRNTAVQAGLAMLNSVWVANPGSYWRMESWGQNGNSRMTVRSGPGANSPIIADVELKQRTLADVSAI